MPGPDMSTFLTPIQLATVIEFVLNTAGALISVYVVFRGSQNVLRMLREDDGMPRGLTHNYPLEYKKGTSDGYKHFGRLD